MKNIQELKNDLVSKIKNYPIVSLGLSLFFGTSGLIIGIAGLYLKEAPFPIIEITISFLIILSLVLLVLLIRQTKLINSFVKDKYASLNGDFWSKKWLGLIQDEQYKNIRDLFCVLNNLGLQVHDKKREIQDENKQKIKDRLIKERIEIIDNGLNEFAEMLSKFLSKVPYNRKFNVRVSIFALNLYKGCPCVFKVAEYPQNYDQEGLYYPIFSNTDFMEVRENLKEHKDSSFICGNIDGFTDFQNSIFDNKGNMQSKVKTNFKSLVNCAIYNVIGKDQHMRGKIGEFELDGYLVCDSENLNIFDDSDKVILKLLASQLQPILINYFIEHGKS